ncbi:MAG: hypothetical protein H7Y86_07415 [Rhizobacter sp.]|nr:hypothetical protein [Ferruginibacter sp.]
MKKLNVCRLLLPFCFICFYTSVKAQDTTKIFFTTSVGLLNPVSSFSNAYQNSLALNSGIEYRFSKHYFAQFVLDFNAVKYSQQVKDGSSVYLFQNTSSSVFLAGINVGRNIPLIPSGKLFCSPYVGAGYVNIGEPRLSVDVRNGIINQEVTRMKGIFARGGTRLAYNTESKILQTIYVDVSYWSANINVQDSRPKAFSFLIGTRFGF